MPPPTLDGEAPININIEVINKVGVLNMFTSNVARPPFRGVTEKNNEWNTFSCQGKSAINRSFSNKKKLNAPSRIKIKNVDVVLPLILLFNL